jgi:hypothetical protein
MTITAYTSSFSPLCSGTNIAVGSVTNAASAYDWFSLINGGSGAFLTAYNAMSTGTAVDIQNKAFVAALAYEARAALLPLVKAEKFHVKFASTKTVISASVTSILSTLSSIQNSTFLSYISGLTPSYTASLSTIYSILNTLKSQESAIYAVGSSVDITSSAIISAFEATPTLTSFTGVKTFLGQLLDPVVLSGAAIPSITSVNGAVGNAASLTTIFTTVSNALAAMTLDADLQATTEMTAQYIFDGYCSQIQGYASLGTTGTWASGASRVGIIPGIDYEIHVEGNFQTGTASAGVVGAPSLTTIFW